MGSDDRRLESAQHEEAGATARVMARKVAGAQRRKQREEVTAALKASQRKGRGRGAR